MEKRRQQRKVSVAKANFIFLSPICVHVSHVNVKHNLWAIYVFYVISIKRADQNPLPLGMPDDTVKLWAEPRDSVPGETGRMRRLAGLSQTGCELATSGTQQDLPMPSMLSWNLGKTKTGLILPVILHWMEPHAERQLEGNQLILAHKSIIEGEVKAAGTW